ncbi:MAG: DUF2142 domain-containing protein [Planctomycetes bacterium]|nr:DUF2142 domain-containing protein [Planctomycetota bacterium]
MRVSWLAVALLLHIALATAYAIATPAFEGPDENSRYEYAQHLANAGKLPLAPALAQARGLPQTDGVLLAHDPPAYYALLAGALLATGADAAIFAPRLNPRFGAPDDPARFLRFEHGSTQGEGPLRLLRLISVAIGALSIVLVHRLGRACCPTNARVADLAALLVACLPMWSFLHGVVHSDTMATALACGTLLALTRWLDGTTRSGRAGVGLGLLLGLGLATKLSTLFLLPLAAAVAVAVLRRDRSRWPAIAAALLVAAAIALPTLLRNHALYGDALALGVHDATFTPIPPEARSNWLFFGYLPTIFPSLFGRFGWFALPPAELLVWIGALATALAVAGWLRGRRNAHVRLPVRHRALLLAALLLVFAATTHFNWSAAQPQGRLLFPAIGPAAVLLAAGMLQLAHGWRGRLGFALALPATAVWVFVGWFLPAFDPALAPAPAWHRSVVDARRPDAARATIAWQIGDLPPTATPPTLRWSEPAAPPDARYALYAHDEHGRVWLAAFEWGGGALALAGGEAVMPDAAFGLLPTDRDVLLTLRRAPVGAGDDPAALPHSPPLRYRRLR